MKRELKFTLKAWPVITITTLGICVLTQLVAEGFGIELKEQQNIALVRKMFVHALDGWRNFGAAALNISLILAIMPALEEFVFRYLLFRLPAGKTAGMRHWTVLTVSSAIFSSAHYVMQPFPDNAFVALAWFGAMQCLLYSKTGSLKYAVLNHSLFNLTSLCLLPLV